MVKDLGLKEWLDAVKNREITLTDFEKYHDLVQRGLISLDSAIKTHDDRIKELKKREMEILESREVKSRADWSGDIWFLMSEVLKAQLDLRLEIDARKDYMVEAMATEIDKLIKTLQDAKQKSLDVAKIEAEKSLMDKFMGEVKDGGWTATQMKLAMELAKEMASIQTEQVKSILDSQNSLINSLVGRVAKLEKAVVLKCDVCGETFTSMEAYNKHLKTHEKTETETKPAEVEEEAQEPEEETPEDKIINFVKTHYPNTRMGVVKTWAKEELSTSWGKINLIINELITNNKLKVERTGFPPSKILKVVE